jgi:hypothetical protein
MGISELSRKTLAFLLVSAVLCAALLPVFSTIAFGARTQHVVVIVLDGNRRGSGVYFYRLEAGGHALVRAMTLTK